MPYAIDDENDLKIKRWERDQMRERWERWWSVAVLLVLAGIAAATVYAAYWLHEIAEVLATK